jgi:hypothetical protein
MKVLNRVVYELDQVQTRLPLLSRGYKRFLLEARGSKSLESLSTWLLMHLGIYEKS